MRQGEVEVAMGAQEVGVGFEHGFLLFAAFHLVQVVEDQVGIVDFGILGTPCVAAGIFVLVPP